MNTLFLFTLLIKHAFCDLYLQFKKVPLNKLKYVGECHLHYFDHGLLTFIVSYLFTFPLEQCLLFASIDYIIHWHVDFIKTVIIKLFNIVDTSLVYWLFQTIDQLLHYSTYLLIVYIAFKGYSFQNVFEKLISFFY